MTKKCSKILSVIMALALITVSISSVAIAAGGPDEAVPAVVGHPGTPHSFTAGPTYTYEGFEDPVPYDSKYHAYTMYDVYKCAFCEYSYEVVGKPRLEIHAPLLYSDVCHFCKYPMS